MRDHVERLIDHSALESDLGCSVFAPVGDDLTSASCEGVELLTRRRFENTDLGAVDRCIELDAGEGAVFLEQHAPRLSTARRVDTDRVWID